MGKARCKLCNRDFVNHEALNSHNKSKHRSEGGVNKKMVIITSSIIVILLVIIFVLATKTPATSVPQTNDLASSNTASSQPTNSGDVQKAELGVIGSSYVLTPSILKKGIPVEITAKPSNLPGCSRTVTIPAFNVYKTVSDGDDIISFTPSQPGTYKIACGMNMYRGTFTVQ